MSDLRDNNPRDNLLESRVRVLEYRAGELNGDLKEIKTDLRQLRDDFGASQRGLSTSEKIALVGAGSGFVIAILSVVALLGTTS